MNIVYPSSSPVKGIKLYVSLFMLYAYIVFDVMSTCPLRTSYPLVTERHQSSSICLMVLALRCTPTRPPPILKVKPNHQLFCL